MSDDTKTTRIQLILRPRQANIIRQIAEANDTSLSGAVRFVIADWLRLREQAHRHNHEEHGE